jgi:hypothetical protein
MSSINTTMNWSSPGMKTKFMRYMKCASALINPNDMTRYSTEAISHCEGCLGYIFGMNLDLVIARVEINLGEYLGSY